MIELIDVSFVALKNLLQSINKPVLLLGYFNVVLCQSERISMFRCVSSMNDFSNWIQELSLIDLPLHGLKFTWRRLK